MKSFKLFAFKQKLDIFWPFVGFFSFHSDAMQGKKRCRMDEKEQFLLERKKFK